MNNAEQKRYALPFFAQSFVGISDSDPTGMLLAAEFRRATGDTDNRPASWCLAFAQFCIRTVDRMFAGDPTVLPNGEWVVGLAKQLKLDPFAAPKPGYLALWQELDSKGGVSQSGHCGIISAVDGTNNIATIEGNTSYSYAGNQRHSGCVAEKVRERAQIPGFLLLGFVSPWADTTTTE